MVKVQNRVQESKLKEQSPKPSTRTKGQSPLTQNTYLKTKPNREYSRFGSLLFSSSLVERARSLARSVHRLEPIIYRSALRSAFMRSSIPSTPGHELIGSLPFELLPKAFDSPSATIASMDEQQAQPALPWLFFPGPAGPQPVHPPQPTCLPALWERTMYMITAATITTSIALTTNVPNVI